MTKSFFSLKMQIMSNFINEIFPPFVWGEMHFCFNGTKNEMSNDKKIEPNKIVKSCQMICSSKQHVFKLSSYFFYFIITFLCSRMFFIFLFISHAVFFLITCNYFLNMEIIFDFLAFDLDAKNQGNSRNLNI